MKLKELLNGIEYKLIQGNFQEDITDICYDSRTYQKGEIFVCLVGIDTDGHQYIQQVIEKGCRCVMICNSIDIPLAPVTIIKVQDTRKTLSALSANFFHHPADQLIKIAITGTKGKTSTSFMIRSILEEKKEKVGLIGTIGTIIDQKLYPHKNTTPESYQIQKSMRLMVDCQTKYLIIETSSQALKVGRVNNILFDYGIFTNLSVDHIGSREHSSYSDYVFSKSLLFKQCKVGILNHDDKEFKTMIAGSSAKVYCYGKKNSDLIIQKVHPVRQLGNLGTQLQTGGISHQNYYINCPGDFSAYNAAAAILLAKLLKIDEHTIKLGLKEFQVPGRCEIINIPNDIKVVIDFAHNKISMESIIKTMRQYHPNRIITVFGCGGGRSLERRRELGETSGALADFSIITTDNSRNDLFCDIARDIQKGICEKKGKFIVIENRKEAIFYALDMAQKKDIILLLGKGHERVQEIKGEKYYFNERKIIQEYLKEKGRNAHE